MLRDETLAELLEAVERFRAAVFALLKTLGKDATAVMRTGSELERLLERAQKELDDDATGTTSKA